MKLGWRRDYIRQKGYFLSIVRHYKERGDIRIYLEILLSLLTISIFAIFALRPTLLTIAELLREIDTKKEVLVKMNSKIDKLTSAQILYDQKRTEVTLLKSSLPDYPKPDTILRQIEGLTVNNNLQLVSLQTGEAPLKGVYKNVETPTEIAVDSNGLVLNLNLVTGIDNYISAENFVTSLSNLRIPFVIERVTISSATQENEKTILINLNGKVLYNNPYAASSSNSDSEDFNVNMDEEEGT